MAGCGGCGPEGCNGPCSTRQERGHADPGGINTPRVSLSEALARVIVDNKVIARTVELYELGVVRVDDLVAQINADKTAGII